MEIEDMNPETAKKILLDAHAVVINMNDTFYYACADSAAIDSCDLADLLPVFEKYEWWAFVAYEAIRRGHNPQIPKRAEHPSFIAAKAMIEDIMSKADKYGEFFELRETIKEAKILTVQQRKRVSRYKFRLRQWFSFFSSR